MLTPRTDGFSAAQNIQPSIPDVVPGPALDPTVVTNNPVEFWSDLAKLVHSGRTCEPSAM